MSFAYQLNRINHLSDIRDDLDINPISSAVSPDSTAPCMPL